MRKHINADHVLLYLSASSCSKRAAFNNLVSANVNKTKPADVKAKILPRIEIDCTLHGGEKREGTGTGYRGIFIPPSIHRLRHANYGKLIHHFTNDCRALPALPGPKRATRDFSQYRLRKGLFEPKRTQWRSAPW